MATNYQGGDAVSLAPIFQGSLRGSLRVREEELARRAAQEKKREAEFKDLSDQIAKLNSKGISVIDMESYAKRTGEIKELAIKSFNETDPKKKMLIKAEINSKIGETEMFITAAVNKNKIASETGKWINDNRETRGTTSNLERFNRLINTKLEDIDERDLDITTYQEIPKAADVDRKLNTLADGLLKGAVEKFDEEPGKRGNKSGVYVTTSKEVPMENYASAVTELYKTDRQVKEFIDYTYGGRPIEEVAIEIAQRKVNEGKLGFSKRDFETDWRPRSTGGSPSSENLVGNVTKNVPIKIGSSTYNADRVGMNVSSVLLPPVEAIDANTGERVDLSEVIGRGYNKGNITAVLKIPDMVNILGDEDVYEFQVIEKNPDFAQQAALIPRGLVAGSGVPEEIVRKFYVGKDVIPTDGTNSKAINGALSKLNGATGTPTTTQRTNTTKRRSVDDL